MNFEALIDGELYQFSYINQSSVLISGQTASYILYKLKKWNCADDIPEKLLLKLANTLDERLQHS
ncbi:MAG TPA: hypothetical protein VHK91_14020 [Flavisolibacter sp.]|jgi:hypothetical protein|nr:hypothetical protein [Flavisolibacter sp.]